MFKIFIIQKIVWYHISNNIFKNVKNIIMCLVCICVFLIRRKISIVKVLLFYLKRENSLIKWGLQFLTYLQKCH